MAMMDDDAVDVDENGEEMTDVIVVVVDQTAATIEKEKREVDDDKFLMKKNVRADRRHCRHRCGEARLSQRRLNPARWFIMNWLTIISYIVGIWAYSTTFIFSLLLRSSDRQRN
jgi:hypothetical protein